MHSPLTQSFLTFPPGLPCRLKLRLFSFHALQTLTAAPGRQAYTKPALHMHETCGLPFSLPGTRGTAALAATCSKQDTRLFSLWHQTHRYSRIVSASLHWSFAGRSNGRGTARAFPSVPARRQGAISCFHRVGLVTSFFQPEPEDSPAPTGRRGGVAHGPAPQPSDSRVHPRPHRPLGGAQAHGGTAARGLGSASPPLVGRGPAQRRRCRRPGPEGGGGGYAEWLRRGQGRGWGSAGRADGRPLARGVEMAAAAAASVAGQADGGGRLSPLSPASVEAVAADWMLEFACYCLCRHFREGCAAEFQWWRDVAQGKGWWRLARFWGRRHLRLSNSCGRFEDSISLQSVRGGFSVLKR